MGQTKNFGLYFFDFGDQLDSSLSVQKEMDRFVLIDKQLYGLYSIFGNGVVSGWTVRDAGFSARTGISVSVDGGLGIINYLASETSIPSTISNLPANSILDIIAVLNGSTLRTRSVDFIYVLSDSNYGNGLKIAQVTTGENSVLLIDNNVKDLISFEALIEEEVNNHKHRGSPSKIDLQDEVKNQLPGARIGDIDVNKITSGVFDSGRLPLIDHNDLKNNGLLTHAALDTFAKTLSKSNKELLGEISTVNLLKTAIFLKYMFTTVDENFINEFILIPGISPDSFIDFDASTASVDLINNCISGYPASTGIFSSIYWNDQQSLSNYYFKNNIIIQNAEVSLDRSSENIKIIEGFNRLGQGESINEFISEIIPSDQTIGVVSEISDQNKIEGDSAGAFNAKVSLIAQYTRDLRTDIAANIGENWSGTYDEFVLWVKTTNQVHESVFLKIFYYDTNSEEENKEKFYGPYTLIEKDNVTTNSDMTKNEFEEIVINMSSLDVSNVTKLVFYTEDLNEDFYFYIDNIHVRKTNLVPPSGIIRYRYSSESDIVFYSLNYDILTPENTNIEIRVKTASAIELLSRSSYSFPIRSGEIFAINGTAIEIEVTLLSEDLISSPILTSLELKTLFSGEFTGFEINSAEDWDRGTYSNIETSLSDIILSSPINVGGLFFSNNDSISEIDNLNSGVNGFSGNKMPISTNQAINWINNPYRKFDFLSSAIRQYNKNFLITDTRNNRILEVDSSGNLIKGWGSSYSSHTDLYPLSFIYNPVSKILSIVFTKSVEILDITKISLYVGSLKMSLTESDTIVEVDKLEGRVIEIELSEATQSFLTNVTSGLTVSIGNGAFTESIANNNNFIPMGYYGWECFIGDFTYIDGILHPIFCKKRDNGNLIFGNSSILYDPILFTSSVSTENVPNLVELNTETNSIEYSSNFIKFSDFSLGGIYEYEDNKFLIAGIKEGTVITGGLTGSELISNSTIVTDKIKFRAAALDALNSYRGYVILLDKNNNTFSNFYISPDGLYPTDIDMDSLGNSFVSESSFGEVSGRIIKLNSFGVITWNYGSGSFNIINNIKTTIENNVVLSL